VEKAFENVESLTLLEEFLVPILGDAGLDKMTVPKHSISFTGELVLLLTQISSLIVLPGSDRRMRCESFGS
jgi:hypothetical protein